MMDIAYGDVHDIAAIMPVMETAFDAAFGEAWTSAQCMSVLSMANSKLVIARLDGTVAGFALTRWVLDEEELLLIGVSHESRRRSVGTAILHHIITDAQAAARQTLFLEVRDGNVAFDFYTKIGFQISGRRLDYYRGIDGEVFDAITMTLPLGDR